MAITKQNIKEVLKRYMKQNNLGYVSIEASLSMDGNNVVLCITEEEDDIDDKLYLN